MSLVCVACEEKFAFSVLKVLLCSDCEDTNLGKRCKYLYEKMIKLQRKVEQIAFIASAEALNLD